MSFYLELCFIVACHVPFHDVLRGAVTYCTALCLLTLNWAVLCCIVLCCSVQCGAVVLRWVIDWTGPHCTSSHHTTEHWTTWLYLYYVGRVVYTVCYVMWCTMVCVYYGVCLWCPIVCVCAMCYVDNDFACPILLLVAGWYPNAKTEIRTTHAPVKNAVFISTSWNR
jgi:hypothetical protein